jgi:hypothetical protein
MDILLCATELVSPRHVGPCERQPGTKLMKGSKGIKQMTGCWRKRTRKIPPLNPQARNRIACVAAGHVTVRCCGHSHVRTSALPRRSNGIDLIAACNAGHQFAPHCDQAPLALFDSELTHVLRSSSPDSGFKKTMPFIADTVSIQWGIQSCSCPGLASSLGLCMLYIGRCYLHDLRFFAFLCILALALIFC